VSSLSSTTSLACCFNLLLSTDQHGRPVNLPVSTNVDEARRMMAAEREQDARSGNLDWARSLARHQAYSVRAAQRTISFCVPALISPPSLHRHQDEDFGEVHFDQEGRSKKRRRTGVPERSEEDMRRSRAIAGTLLTQLAVVAVRVRGCVCGGA
jgi:hypothetical protein